MLYAKIKFQGLDLHNIDFPKRFQKFSITCEHALVEGWRNGEEFICMVANVKCVCQLSSTTNKVTCSLGRQYTIKLARMPWSQKLLLWPSTWNLPILSSKDLPFYFASDTVFCHPIPFSRVQLHWQENWRSVFCPYF